MLKEVLQGKVSEFAIEITSRFMSSGSKEIEIRLMTHSRGLPG